MNQDPNVEADKKTAGYVVGIGASAGGLDALFQVVSELKLSKNSYALVIAQHLKTNFKTSLPELLGSYTSWPVKKIDDKEPILEGHIYVTPPGNEIRVKDNCFHLLPSKKDTKPHPSIDLFFKNLAVEKGNKAIAVVLSGAASDGSAGTVEIKKKGGLVICQEPSTSLYKSMPGAAINSGTCDIICGPSFVASEIENYIHRLEKTPSESKTPSAVDAIFKLLVGKTGTDFSKYKPTTILRRIQKRMDDLDIQNLDLYHHYIKTNPQELDLLFKTVLIGVTEFFRDKKAFESLKKHLGNLLSQKKPGDSVRIWSVGCATGEEPYSLAILLCEYFGESISEYNIQIFGTDIDEKALRHARKAFYKHESLEDVPYEIISKYFVKRENGFEIIKEIRQMVMFSKHDISSHPPYVRLDLISCRNLLIYFSQHLQTEAFRTFHYALNKRGILFLGRSESIGPLTDLFSPLDKSFKIFQTEIGSPLYSLSFNKFLSSNHFLKEEAETTNMNRDLSLRELARETLFQTFDHPFVIINENYQIKEVFGSIRLYAELSEGGMNANLLKMANPELSLVIRSLVLKCKRSATSEESNVIRFKLFDATHFVKLRAKPLLSVSGQEEYFVLIFEKRDEKDYFLLEQKDKDPEAIANYRVQELEQELATAREHLQTFTEELETSNEELQSLNEELQSANEELKSSNEELETSNEELQSANEELHTANSELRATNEMLVIKEEEQKKLKEKFKQSEEKYRMLAENFPNGAIAVIDKDLRYEFAVGTELKKFNLEEEGLIGKKVVPRFPEKERPRLEKALESAFKGRKITIKIDYRDFNFVMTLVPLQNSEAETERVMVVSQNISEFKQLSAELSESEARFQSMADSAPVFIWMAGKDKKCTYFNKTWLEFTGNSFDQQAKMGLLGSIHEDDKERCSSIFERAYGNQKRFTQEYRLKKHDGEYRWVMDHGVPRFSKDGEFLGFIGSCMDIQEIKEVEERKGEFMNIASHELKTPLTTAKAYIQLAQEAIEEIPNTQVQLYVQESIKAIDKLNSLITELLDVGRIESGKLKFNLEPMDFDAFMAENIAEHKWSMPDLNIDFIGKTGKQILGNRLRLEQVIDNLLSNAQKYAARSERIRVEIKTTGNKVMCSVSDTGNGIAKSRLERIFERFYRANENSETSGLGLGLYICREILTRHNGEIWAESEAGKGTTFKFTIPYIAN